MAGHAEFCRPFTGGRGAQRYVPTLLGTVRDRRKGTDSIGCDKRVARPLRFIPRGCRADDGEDPAELKPQLSFREHSDEESAEFRQDPSLRQTVVQDDTIIETRDEYLIGCH